MSSRRIFLTATVIAIVAIAAIGFRQYRTDMAAWREVERSLEHLENRLERQPPKNLAAEIAEAHAAIAAFAAWPHRFPRNYAAKLQAAERGLRYLTIAANQARDIHDWESMTTYPEVTRFLARGCEGDHLAFSRVAISEAFAVAGSALIRGAASETAEPPSGRQEGFYRPLDLPKEVAACRQVERAAFRAPVDGAAGIQIRRGTRVEYRVDISNPGGCLMTPYVDDQILPIPHDNLYSVRLRAAREVRLEKVFCDSAKPKDSIAISINGQSYDPVWLLGESGLDYTAQLVPQHPDRDGGSYALITPEKKGDAGWIALNGTDEGKSQHPHP